MLQTRSPANTAPTTITENASIRALHPPHSKNKKGLTRDRAFFVPANSAVNATWLARGSSSPPTIFLALKRSSSRARLTKETSLASRGRLVS
jgi:hypothetical protein